MAVSEGAFTEREVKAFSEHFTTSNFELEESDNPVIAFLLTLICCKSEPENENDEVSLLPAMFRFCKLAFFEAEIVNLLKTLFSQFKSVNTLHADKSSEAIALF